MKKFKHFLRWFLPVAFVLWTLPITYDFWDNAKEQVFTGTVVDKYTSASVGRHSISQYHKIQFCLINDKSKCTSVNIRSSTWERTNIGDIQSYTLRKSEFISNHLRNNLGLFFFAVYSSCLLLGVCLLVYFLIYSDD